MFKPTKKALSSSISCLFTPKHIPNPTVQNLITALQIHILELNIILKAIYYFKNKNFAFFDNVIGDRKCQTRTSMILNLANNLNFLNQELFYQESRTQEHLHKTKLLLENLQNYNYLQIKDLLKKLQSLTLHDYLEKNGLIYTPPFHTKLISLCFFATPISMPTILSNNTFLSSNKINKLLTECKMHLCKLSIQYEQALAAQYCTKEEQPILNQIETKGFCSMTPFFPSFKAIFEKMKDNQEALFIKNTIFCLCGNVKKRVDTLFMYKKNKFISVPIHNNDNIPATIILSYQFPGSLNQLKKLLNIPSKESYILKEYQRPCICPQQIQEQTIENIEEAILANFAHHPQFTNDTEIDWQRPGLVDSDLHKEYKYLKTLSGFSIDDMSKFYIDHIYPATIKDALEQDSSSIMAKVIEQKMDFITHHDATLCPC